MHRGTTDYTWGLLWGYRGSRMHVGIGTPSPSLVSTRPPTPNPTYATRTHTPPTQYSDFSRIVCTSPALTSVSPLYINFSRPRCLIQTTPLTILQSTPIHPNPPQPPHPTPHPHSLRRARSTTSGSAPFTPASAMRCWTVAVHRPAAKTEKEEGDDTNRLVILFLSLPPLLCVPLLFSSTLRDSTTTRRDGF